MQPSRGNVLDFLQARLLVHGTVVFAEEVVEEFGGGPSDGTHDPHQSEDHGRAVGADGEAVSDADGLGDDFAEDD